MEHRTLGTSGLRVSPICLGTMTFGEPVNEADSIRLVHAALDMGINFVDTANVYEGYRRVLGSAGGWAEEIVGKALKDRRDQAVLATKVCAPLGPGDQDRGLGALHMHREVDASLRRLQTDVIDLYIIHWPDRMTPRESTLQTMDQIMRAGKVRHFGVSNHSAWQLCEFVWMSKQHGWPRVVSSQIPFSLLHRHFQHDLRFCEEYNIGVTPYQTLQSGLLTGKYKRGQDAPTGSRAAEKPAWIGERDDALYDKLEAFENLAGEIGVPPGQYALAWALTQPAMASLIVGVKRVEQIEDAIAATAVRIPADHMEKIDAIFEQPWRQMDPIRPA
ncbi:MAG: aldo/keto reductase [Planctomycetaceae bacterium]|nr:aldo/keto reductase [Planctomycetaceae bacterium]